MEYVKPRMVDLDSHSRARQALEALQTARTIGATQVFCAMDKEFSRDFDQVKDLHRISVASAIAHELKPVIEFSENERASATGFCGTDTHITGKLITIPEDAFLKVVTILKEISR